MTRSPVASMFALAGVMLVAMTGFGIFLPIFPFLGLQTGASATAITWAMGAYSLGQFAAAPLWGRVSDKIGRKPVLIIGLIGSVISYLIIAHAETVWHLGGARLFGGLMAGNAGAAFAAAADLADDRTRARNMGLLGASVGFGFIAGPAIGAALIGGEASPEGFQRICYVAAGFAAAAALVALLFFGETRALGASATEQRARSWSLLMQRPALAFFVGLTLVTIAAQALLETTFGLWAHAVLSWGPRDVGWALAGMGLMAALLQGGGAGALARRLGEGRTLALGLFAFIVGFLLLANARAAGGAYASLAVITLGVGLATPALQSLVAAQAEARDTGVVMGLNQSASALGRALGPAIAGLLFTASHAAPYWAGAALMIVALTASFVALPIVLSAPRKI